MHNCYRAYGLSWRSDLPLPELSIGEPPADVEITLGRVQRNPPDLDEEMAVRVLPGGTTLFQHGVGGFYVQDGRSIVVERADGVDDDLLRLFLLGPALGTLMRQRGRLVLHASAVAMDGGAVLFAGNSGDGKSTLAAAFHSRGHAVLTDDIVAVDATGPHVRVFPAFPRLKLDARGAAAAQVCHSPMLAPNGKRYFPAEPGFAHVPVALKRVYVLADAEVSSVEPLPPHEALVELLRHSYGARSLQALGRRMHFQQCVAVARTASVRRLKRRKAIEDLPELVQMVERDVATVA